MFTSARTLRVALAVATLSGAVLASAAVAQQASPPLAGAPPMAGDNFTMVPAEGRHLKIDRRTGRVSVCSEAGGSWSCRLVADDRMAYEDEIERLRAENDRLSAEVADLRKRLEARETAENWIGPEDEKKLDEFFDLSEKAFRRFFGMVETLKRDFNQEEL